MPKTSVSVECNDLNFGWLSIGTQMVVALISAFLNAWIAFGIITSLLLGLSVEVWKKGKWK